jgi:hypothetical protein
MNSLGIPLGKEAAIARERSAKDFWEKGLGDERA